jgi:hypothetical protein
MPVPKVPKRIANPLRAFSTNEYDTPIHYQTDTSRILIPQRASAPIIQNQVTDIKSQNNEMIELIAFENAPNPVTYPTLPPADWNIHEYPLRSTLTCGDMYYCHHEAKIFEENGNIGYITAPTNEQITQVRERPIPKIAANFDKQTNKFTWQSPEHGTLIWKNPHWYSDKL